LGGGIGPALTPFNPLGFGCRPRRRPRGSNRRCGPLPAHCRAPSRPGHTGAVTGLVPRPSVLDMECSLLLKDCTSHTSDGGTTGKGEKARSTRRCVCRDGYSRKIYSAAEKAEIHCSLPSVSSSTKPTTIACSINKRKIAHTHSLHSREDAEPQAT